MPKAPLVYSTEVSTRLGKKLQRMATKPKGVQLRDLIQQHKEAIQGALQSGYTYEEIIENSFKDLGITIRPNTLKQYLRDGKGEGESE